MCYCLREGGRPFLLGFREWARIVVDWRASPRRTVDQVDPGEAVALLAPTSYLSVVWFGNADIRLLSSPSIAEELLDRISYSVYQTHQSGSTELTEQRSLG